MERRFDLKLANGKVVSWVGKDEQDAIRRYVDCIRPGIEVVATRPAAGPSVSVLGNGRIIG